MSVGRAWLRLVRPEDLKELNARAEADGHAVICPTHVFVKRDEAGAELLCGYASIASVPLVLPWFDTERCQARDSVQLINVMENLVASLTGKDEALVCVPVVKGSPFEPEMERLGYVKTSEAVVTFKRVK